METTIGPYWLSRVQDTVKSKSDSDIFELAEEITRAVNSSNGRHPNIMSAFVGAKYFLLALDLMCKYHRVEKPDVLSSCRESTLVVVRSSIVYICRAGKKQLTVEQLGDLLGGRDHSTIVHMEHRICPKMVLDTKYKEVLDDAISMIENQTTQPADQPNAY